MDYKNQKEAIDKLARELGRISGSKSLPKVFIELKKEEFGYQIPKSTHITNLLLKYNTSKKRFVVLQKIFGLHTRLNQVIVREIKPALNKLGFDYRDGAIIEFKPKKQTSLKKSVKVATRKYARKSSIVSEAVVRRGEKLAEAYLPSRFIFGDVFYVYFRTNCRRCRLFGWEV